MGILSCLQVKHEHWELCLHGYKMRLMMGHYAIPRENR